MLSPHEAGGLPLYYQVEQALRGRIDANDLLPGEPLPSESTLCETFGVSRITVRRALDALTQQGRIVRRQGIGSFVAEPVCGVNSRLSGLLPELIASTEGIDYVCLDIADAPAPSAIARLLALPASAAATRVHTVGRIEPDVPLVYTEIWFPPDIGRHLDRDGMTTRGASVAAIERILNAKVERAEQLIRPSRADAAIAKLFDIARGTPLLNIIRTYFLKGGRPIQTGFAQYHPDRNSYRIEFS